MDTVFSVWKKIEIFVSFTGKEVHLQKVWRKGCKAPYLNPWKLKYLSRLVLRIPNSNNLEVKSFRAKVFQSCHKSHLGQISQCQLPLKSSCPRVIYLTHLLDLLHLTCEYHPFLQSYCNFSYITQPFSDWVSNHDNLLQKMKTTYHHRSSSRIDYFKKSHEFFVHCPRNSEFCEDCDMHSHILCFLRCLLVKLASLTA